MSSLSHRTKHSSFFLTCVSIRHYVRCFVVQSIGCLVVQKTLNSLNSFVAKKTHRSAILTWKKNLCNNENQQNELAQEIRNTQKKGKNDCVHKK